ncbi:NADP-dependent oxidoreductase [Nocardia sp. NBC_01327]|uniref:NADP-dependent oxidoreductase n=1 Tax=Nocardia sp. NBC_01327 TaxID=2903593 RepID=UPI002E0EF893|nr:NADP-dependent oxidoreductase [Nocardia sp. NBC_01327]
MKALRIHERGGADLLVLEEVPEPQHVTGDVVVGVGAASFVPDELDWPGTWTNRAGQDRTPSVPGHEVAGIVTEVHYGTTGFAVGDRVCGMTDWHRDGSMAEYVAVEARNLAPLPAALDYVQGAALPLAGLTAWQGLFDHGNLQPGQTVLVHGAAGGTGSLIVQIAKDTGAHVIATGRARSENLAKELGADRFIDLALDPELTGVGPVDLVFDTVGGPVLEHSAAVLKPGGTLVSITAPPPVTPPDGRAVFFIVEPNRDQLRKVLHLAEIGRLRAQVGAVYPLSEAKEAFLAKRNGVPGKIVVTT